MARTSYILGIVCWLLVSLAPALAASSTGLPAIAHAEVETAKLGSCQKLTATIPSKDQCSGTAAHSAATARPRSGKDNKVLNAGITSVYQIIAGTVQAKILVLPILPIARRRRAHFWQIYAASMRLRN